MPTTIARCGSGVLVAEGERWTFGHQPGTGGNVAIFVLALFGVILSANAITIAVTQHFAGLALLLVGVPLVAGAVGALRRREVLRTTASVVPLVVLDFANGVLLDRSGRAIAQLAGIAFSARMQIASSARALECRWAGGSLVVLRGDAFGGGVGPAIDALRSRGLRA